MPSPLDSPIPVIVFGVVAEAILAIILVRTGRGVVLYLMGGVLALVIIGLVIEHLVMTDNKRIAATLDRACSAVAANDLNRLLAEIVPSAEQTRDYARMALERATFSEAGVHNLHIEINQLTSPPTARVRMTGSATFQDRHGEFPYNHYIAEIVVELERHGDRWLILRVVEVRGPGGKEQPMPVP